MSSAAVVAGTVALVAALLGVITAPAAHADGTVKPGNQKCIDLVPGARELKVENPPSGSHTDGTLPVVRAPDRHDHRTGSGPAGW